MRIGDVVFWRDADRSRTGLVLGVDYDQVSVWTRVGAIWGPVFLMRESLHRTAEEAPKGEEAKYV